MTKPNPMTIARLKVVRTTDFGAFLDGGTDQSVDDILLHKHQQTAKVEVGQLIDVFLYLDPKKRLAASMRVPQMKIGQIARVKVINTTHDGAFVDVGAERGIFMPFAEMIGRPRVGDIVWAKLYTDKSGRLAMTMNVADEIRRASKPAVNVKKGDMIKGTIYNITEVGAFMLSTDRYIVFIATKDTPRRLRCGETVEARVTFIRPDGRLNASLREQKENAMSTDANKILKFMKDGDGTISENIHPVVIYRNFNISKSAFKRAIGQLFKARLIERTRDGFKLSDGNTDYNADQSKRKMKRSPRKFQKGIVIKRR